MKKEQEIISESDDKNRFTKELIDIIVKGERQSYQGEKMQESVFALTRKVKEKNFVDLDGIIAHFQLQQAQVINKFIIIEEGERRTPEQERLISAFRNNQGIDPLEVFICVKALVEERLRIEMWPNYDEIKNERVQNKEE